MDSYVQWAIGGTTSICLGLIGLLSNKKLDKEVYSAHREDTIARIERLRADTKDDIVEIKKTLSKIFDKIDIISQRCNYCEHKKE